MTLFTKENCRLCTQLKQQFDLSAMDVYVEVLDDESPGALAHLAWHSLVETARKSLPLLVLDDSSTVDEFPHIERHLATRARNYGLGTRPGTGNRSCEDGSCTFS